MNDPITSLQNPRVRRALRLHSARGRKQQQRIIIFGSREIARAVDAGLELDELFVASPTDSGSAPLTARSTWLVSEAVMEKLEYGNRADGHVAIASRPSTSLSAMDFPFEDRRGTDSDAVTDSQLILVVEGIEKPGNLGAMLRSADAAGANGMLICNPLTDPFHPNCIRASTGVVFRLPIGMGSTPEVQSWLQRHRFRVLTAMLDGATDFYEADLNGHLALVLGNEASGLSPAWRGDEFTPVKLPMNGQADSLNVSVSAAVMLFEAFRQRRAGENPPATASESH